MGPVSLLAQVVLVTDRRELVELLRASARTHGAAQVRDDASRDGGMQMVTALRAKSVERDDRKSLEDTTDKYLQTFSRGEELRAGSLKHTQHRPEKEGPCDGRLSRDLKKKKP